MTVRKKTSVETSALIPSRRHLLSWGGIVALGALLIPLVASILLVDPDSPPNSLLLIGRLHPILVHFPIGLVLLAAALEALSTLFRTFRFLRRATSFVLFLGAASAVTAAAAGFLLSLEGGYDARLVAWHKWLGLTTATGAVVAFVLKMSAARGRTPVIYGAYVGVLGATVLTLGIVGHLGGSLTHGPEYLTYYLPPRFATRFGFAGETAGPRITNIQTARIYQDLVFPLLEDRCVECHGATRVKGELRLDTPEGLSAGGENGPVIVAGDPDRSELWRRVTLPLEHEEIMPPDGAEPLTIGETELIRWWIQHGASTELRVSNISEIPSSVATLFARIAPPTRGLDLASFDVAPVDSNTIRNLRAEGYGIQGVARDLPVLQVSTFNLRSGFDDEKLKRLLPLAEQIVWLDLSGSRVSDPGLATVARMPHLTRLHLERTSIGDAGLAHLRELEHLEYLNLVGTRVTDAGLRHLERSTGLRAIYLWETRVTREGMRRLQDRLPDLRLIFDAEPA